MKTRVAQRIAPRAHSVHGGAGFTLLEVLIAVLVLSFGVLGVVGLQAASLQANRDARLQSSAVRLGRELADMMRGNKSVAILTAAASNPYLYDTTTSAALAPPQDCYLVYCSSVTNVATYEMNEWVTRVARELPGARVKVCFDTNPYDANGLPQWDCSNDGGVSVLKIGWTRLTTNRAAVAASAIDVATKPTIILPLVAGSSQ